MEGLLTTNDLILIGLIVLGSAFLMVLIKIITRKKKYDPKKEEKKIKTLERTYGILLSNKLFRNYIIKATKKYGALSVYSQSEIKCNIVKDFRTTVFGTVAAMVVSAIAFHEIFAVVLCTYGAITIFAVRADKQIEKATVRVYAEVKTFISSLRIEFKKSKGDILVAIEGSQCGPHIIRSIDEIKQVLVAPNTEANLERFYQNTPFKQLQTLAMVCSNIYIHGDTSVGGDTSVFDEAMLLMEADINQKLEEISYEKILYKLQIPIFDALEWLAMTGVLLTIGLKYLMIMIMPSTESVYNSIIGMLIQNASIGLSIYSYNTVARAHLQQVILPDDRMGIVVKLMKSRLVQSFMRAMSPKGQKRRILEHKLKISVSKHTVDSLWCEKWVMATIAFVGIMLMTFTAPTVEKQFLDTYINSFDLMADNSAYEDENGKILYTKEDVLALDNEYIAIRNSGLWSEMSDEDIQDIKELLKEHMPTLTTIQVEDQMSRLETKYTKLNNVSYHWWYTIIAIAAAGVGYWFPGKKLKSRLELAIFEEEEEFLQLQMITLILSSLNMDTLDTLGHLTNIADFHKNELAQCYYGYASDPERSLQTLEDSVQSINFKLFVGKLKETVENLSVKEVFADLRNDRAHICNERDNFIKSNISYKRAKMGKMALMPMNVAIYGMMVFPLLYSGITGLLDTMTSIQEM